MTYEEIKKSFKDPLSLENIRVILKTSKRIVAWLLQNGYIKCEIKEYQTKQGTVPRYSVKIDDLIDYMEKVESGELVIALPKGNFLANEANDKIKDYAFPKKPPVELREWLYNEWGDYGEEIPRVTAIKLIGYDDRTFTGWASLGKISQRMGEGVVTVENVTVKKMGYITKQSLINYLCDEESGYKALKRNKDNQVLPRDLSAADLKQYLTAKWESLDANLPYATVIEITGYSDSNVTRLAIQKKVDSFYASGVKKTAKKPVANMVFINKDSLIDFFCGEGYAITQKSAKHIELLKKFFNK